MFDQVMSMAQVTTLPIGPARAATRRPAQLPRRRPLRASDLPARGHDRLIGVPAVGSEDFHLWTEWIGRCLAERGTASVDAHLAGFAASVLDLGVEPLQARLVADRSTPEVARARAFYAVLSGLEDDPGPAAA
jgi:hypothetical protein